MILQVVDNFFDNLNRIESNLKKIKLYSQEEFNKKFNDTQTWPGFRSQAIHLENPILFELFLKEFTQKFNLRGYFEINLYLHLRLQEDQQKDWIHKDNPHDASLIIYLNENLDSGTNFYQDTNDKEDMVIGMLKNRCILFNSMVNHKSRLNFGNNLEDGRLTMNGFIKYKK
jgi:hypothetical protein